MAAGEVLELLAQTDCRQLHLFGNRLAALPADLARAVPDLEFLDISSNDLRDPAALPARATLFLLDTGKSWIKQSLCQHGALAYGV